MLVHLSAAIRSVRHGRLRSAITALGIAVATAFAATAATAAWTYQSADAVLGADARSNLGADARSSLGADVVWSMTARPADEAQLAEALDRPGVAQWTPALIGRTYIRSPRRSSIVFVKGIDPTAYPFYGRSRLDGPGDGLQPGEVALTQNVADRLGVTAGDMVELHDGAANHTFRVAHVVSLYTEQAQDANIFGVAYMNLEEARGLLRAAPGAVHQVLIRADDPAALEAARAELEAAQPLSKTHSAVEEHRRLRARVDDLMLFLHIFGAAAVLIASIGVANTAQMLVRGRVREIATMKAVGVRPRQVLALMLTEAGVISSAGVLLGLLLTLAVSGAATLYLGRFLQLDLAWQMRPAALLLGGAVGLGAALVAAWLPATAAARIPPALAWREDGTDAAARALRPSLGNRLQVLLFVGVLAGVYLHPLRGADAPIWDSLLRGLFAALGGAAVLNLLAWVSGLLLRLLGMGKGLARRTAYLALHDLRAGSRRNALTALCLTVSVLAVGLSGLMGPALKQGLRQQLATQSGGNLFVVAPADAEAEVGAVLRRMLPAGSVARAVNVDAALITVGGRPGEEAQAEAIAAGAEYLADPAFRLQGMDLAGERPSYVITAGRDLTAADAGRPVLLMLDAMAADLEIAVGDEVVLGLGPEQVAFEVVGLMKTELVKTAFMRTSADMLERVGPRSVSFTAQVPADEVLEAMKDLNDALSSAAYVLHVDDQLLAVTQTLDFQSAILGIVSLLSLVAALLLILNDVSLSIAQRRRELAVMKVTGIAPGHLLGGMAVQYGLIGVVGGVQGGLLSVLAVAVIAGIILQTRVYVDALALATPLVTGAVAAATAALAAWPGVAQRPDVILRTG